MKTIRWRAAICAALIALAGPAVAATSTDYSDLWWNPAENGWGATINQQGEVVFLVLYVYGEDRGATWFVASDMRPLVFVAPAPPTWQGPLYRATGPYFAGPFAASAVNVEPVGTATLQFETAERGKLTYNVGSVAVEKRIERLTWRASPLSGSYYGGLNITSFNCPNTTVRIPNNVLGDMSVTHTGSQVRIEFEATRVSGQTATCEFEGGHRQDGRLGTVTGTFVCYVGNGVTDLGEDQAPSFVVHTGPFTVDRIEAGAEGFFGRLSANDQNCSYTGRFGGVRLP